MSKLREQFSVTDRLREYIERMLSVIIENNPQLLEITTGTGASLGCMGTLSFESSTSDQRQSTFMPEQNSTIPRPTVPSTESTNTEPLSTVEKVKNPADKYCRL